MAPVLWAAEPPAAALADEPAVVSGRVLLPDGKPAVGAHVAVIGNRRRTARVVDDDRRRKALAETTADEKGEYVLRLRGVSQVTHVSGYVIVRRDGAAIAWREIDFDAAETRAEFKLKPEVPLRIRLVDIEGRPAAGLRLSIASVVERSEGEKYPQGIHYPESDQAPAAWVAALIAGEHGNAVVYGLAADQGVSLLVQGDDRFARQNIALNTGRPEERGGTDATYRPLVKNVEPSEEATLALAPAQVFEGTVRYADSGEPVPQARLSIWASQQELGSMMSASGTADEQGRYHITPRPGIRFGLTAHPPHGTPYLGRKTPVSEAIHWEGGERVKRVDLTLPRGVLVRGTIVNCATGAPVAGAAVQYIPESSNNPNESDDILTGWQAIETTDNDGRFAMAVVPGPGRLLANSAKGAYVLRQISERELHSGKSGGRRYYAQAYAKLNPEAGGSAVEVKLELEPGAAVTGRIVDEAGTPIDEALMISRLDVSWQTPFWRGHAATTRGGRFELSGLADGVEYPVYFLDAKRKLGATEVMKAGDNERLVILKPCGTARLRLVDDKGEPVPANYGLLRMVVTPGAYLYDREASERGELAADADFVTNIDRTNHHFPTRDDEDGVRVLNALIPGATYRIAGMRGEKLQVVKEFQLKANETVDFGDIVVERSRR